MLRLSYKSKFGQVVELIRQLNITFAAWLSMRIPKLKLLSQAKKLGHKDFFSCLLSELRFKTKYLYTCGSYVYQ